MAMNQPLKTNDQVNRDAASVVPTSESVDGGSGSTPCSFSAIDLREPVRRAVALGTFLPIRNNIEAPERSDEGLFSVPRDTQDLFQEVIDRYGLKFGASTGWLLKIDECDFCAATLHLEGKWDQGIPAADFEAAIARRHDGVSRIVGQEDIGVSFAIDLG